MNKDRFFDREFYLQTIKKRVIDLKDGYRQNLAIIGDESVGKTSLIHKFLYSFYDNNYIVMYLEARPETLNSFVKRFVGILLYNFLINSGLELKEDLDYLLEKSRRYIPITVEKINYILKCISRRKKINIFSELLSLTNSISQESQKLCVVILDEFHNLEKIGIKNIYKEWSKLLITQKKTMYIIMSSMKLKTKTILSKNLSLLFGNFEVIEIEPFDLKTSEEYLDIKVKDMGMDPAVKDFIVHFSGGYPLYLETISEAVLKQNTGDLADVLEELLFNSSGTLNQRFSNYLKRFLDTSYSNEYISVLYLIANGRNRIKDIAHIMRKQLKELMPRVNYLLELDTITRSGDFLKINDRIFSFWLKFVYQGKIQSLTFDAKNQKAKFRDNIQDMIQDFYLSSKKPLAERITELMKLFEDEVMQVERKKIRLNHFREIKPLEFRNRNIRDGLIGRSSECLWILAFKKDALTEEDISDFAKECKKYRHKLQRKIIITLENEIDPNARLRALEEKIWTWDINKVNQLLDLYSKPWIIA